MARLIPKAMQLGELLTPAVRERIISNYPKCMPLRTTTAGNLLVIFCASLEDRFFKLFHMVGHSKPCRARSPETLAACRLHLVEATVSFARYIKTW